MLVGGRWLVVAVALEALSTGCCISRHRAAEIKADLRARNDARAEPAMRRAAERYGAALLPNRAEQLGLTPFCDERSPCPRSGGYCVDNAGLPPVVSRLVNAHHLVDQHGKRTVAVSVPHASNMTRLALRDDTLFVLAPQRTLHKLRTRVQCDCDAGYGILFQSDQFIFKSLCNDRDLRPNDQLPQKRIEILIVASMGGRTISKTARGARRVGVREKPDAGRWI